jgi:gamma-glutamyltranspeptidase
LRETQAGRNVYILSPPRSRLQSFAAASFAEPLNGLLSKDYAKERARLVNPERNDPSIKPGDPYPFQSETNPYLDLLKKWNNQAAHDRERGERAGEAEL